MGAGLESSLAAYRAAAADVVAARTRLKAQSATLFAGLSAVARRHEKEVGAVFQELGFSDLYEERFGSSYGSHLNSAWLAEDGRALDCTFGSYFRGGEQEDVFHLPLKYLTGDTDVLLAQDVAHFRKALLRLRAAQERPATPEQADVSTYLRLHEQFKGMSEAELAAAAAAAPQP